MNSKKALAMMLSMSMAASMAPVTAMADEGAPAVKYGTINMEYADFFYGELNHVEADLNTVTPDLSVDKAAGYREEGMYDAVTSATAQKSTRYATAWVETDVVNDESKGEATGVNLKGIKDVQIAINEELYNNIMNSGDTSSKIYEYLQNATWSEDAFAGEYKVVNADGTFSEMITEEGQYVDADAVVNLKTSTNWGDYEISIDNLGTEELQATTDNMYGIVVTDEAGVNYGMLHSDNTWLRTYNFAWAVDDVFPVHGNQLPYQRTDGLNGGNTIKKITYLLKGAPDIVVEADTYLKTLLGEEVNGSAAPVAYNSEGMTVQFELNNLPADDYTLGTLVKGMRHGQTVDPSLYSYDAASKVLTLDGTCAAGSDYIATFQSEAYGDLKVIFEITPLESAVVMEDVVVEATGEAVAAPVYEISGSTGEVTGKWFSDEACTQEMEAAPAMPGTYYYKVAVAADSYHSAAEAVAKVEVVKAAQTIQVAESVKKTYGDKAFSLKAEAQTELTYESSNKKVAVVDANGKVTIKGAGTAVITVTAAETELVNGASAKVTITVKAAAPTIKVKNTSETIKASKVKKAAQSFSMKATVNSKGKLSFKKVSGSSKLTVNKTSGKVTLKKGTKKGTYTMKVKVSAAAKGNYKAASKTVTIKVKVK